MHLYLVPTIAIEVSKKVLLIDIDMNTLTRSLGIDNTTYF